MATKITLSQTCEGLIRFKTAAGLSVHTISDHIYTFKKVFIFFSKETRFSSISLSDMIDFFAWLQDGYISEPDGVAPRGKIRLSPKSINNIHTNLSSLWTWAVDEGFAKENFIRKIKRPPVVSPVVEPFTKSDIEMLLKSCARSRTWKNRPSTTNSRPTEERDRAIILTLLDTGCRASELCGIRFGDIKMKDNSIKIRGKGAGRGNKERILYIGKRTTHALWKYLLPRLDTIREEENVFVVGSADDYRPMNRGVLRTHLHRLGKLADVKKTYPH